MLNNAPFHEVPITWVSGDGGQCRSGSEKAASFLDWQAWVAAWTITAQKILRRKLLDFEDIKQMKNRMTALCLVKTSGLWLYWEQLSQLFYKRQSGARALSRSQESAVCWGSSFPIAVQWRPCVGIIDFIFSCLIKNLVRSSQLLFLALNMNTPVSNNALRIM